jgi:FkbM family methyltransferase
MKVTNRTCAKSFRLCQPPLSIRRHLLLVAPYIIQPTMALLHTVLRRVRPAPLAAALKKLVNVQRRKVVLEDGAKFYVDPVSDFGHRVTSPIGYEPGLTQLAKHVLGWKDVFVDVGANEGYFSVLAARQGAIVHAIEPQAALTPVIQENSRLNNVTIHTHQIALADRRGTAMLHVADSTNSGSSSLFGRHRADHDECVKVLPLDHVLKRASIRHVRLLKIDCEGAEKIVIPGAYTTLARNRVDFISIEYHSTIIGVVACAEIDHTIRDHGYGCVMLGNGLWAYHLPGLESQLAALGPLKAVPPL